jgi:hypothetical protein
VIDLMRSYNAERRLRKALLVVLASIRFRSATKGKTYIQGIEKECSVDVVVSTRKSTSKVHPKSTSNKGTPLSTIKR